MAKATNPRKPAGDKRKHASAAKRRGRKRGARARKVTPTVRPARARRPSGGAKRSAAAGSRRAADKRTEARAPAVAPVPELPRMPPPLPVPIASFTF
jgi:hypothetical protein